MLKFLFNLLLLGGIILFIISLYTLFLYAHPRRYLTPFTPRDLELWYDNMTLKSEDGLKLAAWFLPNKDSDAAIVICHGYPADKGDLLKLASFLAKDYNLLFFDFRCMGRSDGEKSTIGDKERLDFAAAVNALKEKGFKKIGAFGFSMGGSVIIHANSPDIKAAVTDSAFASLEGTLLALYKRYGPLKHILAFFTKKQAKMIFKMDIESVTPAHTIKELKFPILLIHSRSDELVPVENANTLHAANPKSELWIIDDALHGQTRRVKTDEYEKKVLDFFKANLK